MSAQKTPTRIYAVTNTTTGDVSLVRATTAAQATRHATRALFVTKVASQDALVAAMQLGAKVEDAGSEDEQE